nr:lysoplasmalogenase [uncultured Rhodococcus sp.]
MKRSNWSRLTFTAAVAVTVVGAVTGADRMHRLAKPLMVPALAAGVPRMTPSLGTALAAATIGDVLLIDPDDDRRILRGAAAFAIMQGCYSSMLISRGARPTVIEAVPRYGGWAVAATLLARRSAAVAPGLAGYGLTLATMATLAAAPAAAPDRGTRRRLALGGILFTVSDGLIVWRRLFLHADAPRRYAEGAILATYAGAQLLLVEGLSREQ